MSTRQELQTQKYDLERELSRLQQLLSAETNPTQVDQMLEQIAAQQGQLSQIEAQLSTEIGNSDEGSVFKLKGIGDGVVRRGVGTTGWDAGVDLRMAYVPTAIYHLLDQEKSPLLECKIKNALRTTIRVRIISKIEKYSAEAINTLEVAANSEESIRQLPTLFPEEIESLNELTRATLNVKIENLETNKIETHTTKPLWLLSRNSAPLEVRDPSTGIITDLSRYLGAFVTPNAPSIMKFLRTAAKHHPDGQLYGYQKEALPQVKAIFEALKQDSQITYINSLVTFNPEQGASSQRVRLPRESLEDQSANCIDGTLLFASLLEAASLHPAIVIVPSHAFVGWQNQRDVDEWSYLETTMISTNSFEEALNIGNRKVKTFSAIAAKDPSAFRRWALRDLRTQYSITPLE